MTTQQSEKKFRAFIAIDLPPDVKQELAVFMYLLKKQDKKTHWVHSDTFHITLKFLGNISEEEAKKIIEIVTPIVQTHRHFDIAFNRILYLPSSHGPRLVALAPTPVSPLASLAIDIEHALTAANFPPEKGEFKPHLTLGRLCTKTRSKKYSLPKIDHDPKTKFRAKTVILFKSTQGKNGSIYTPIQEIPLG